MIAELEDFEDRHGDVAADQEDRVTVLLSDASALILGGISHSEETWVEGAIAEASGVEIPQEVVSICVEVAYRAWANPDALQRAEVGDVRTYWRGDSAGALYLTVEERRTVRRAAAVSSFLAVSLSSPYPPDVDAMDPEDPDA